MIASVSFIQARTNAVLDKLRFADRLVREADELSSQVAAKEGADAKKQQSPQRQRQNQAIRWFFVALLCTTPVHAEAGGLVPLLCNRLASLWNKMRCHHTALFWANESLKIVPEDYHAHLNKCQALLDLGRFSQAIEAANEALAVLEGSCAPIKRILASARVSHGGPSTTAVATRKSWKLCNDITGLILGFLTNSDRQSAAVVCKHWAGVTRQVVLRNLTEEKPSKVAAYLRRAESSAVDIGSVGQYVFSSRRDEWIDGSRETFALKAVNECNAASLRWALLSWSRLSASLISDEGTSKTILGCCLDRCFSEQRKPEDRARSVELLRVALEYGCNPNTRVTPKQVDWEEEGRRVSRGLLPLEKAMLAGSKEVLSLLVRYGAEPERILKGLGASKKLSSLELLFAFYPALLEQRELASKLTTECVAEGWLDGLKMCHQAGIFSKYPSLVDGLIEESLKRLKTLVEPGVSDALWSESDKLPFTTGALELLMACRNTRGAGLSPDCEAMAIAKHLDGVLWTTKLKYIVT
jgi:tetratricopeptide (TPR) repeat protein